MKIYLVGGAVRDNLLGLEIKDRDYVVVGSTPEEMLKKGFKPVGKDFPVFLHPQSHDEYALARTERKVAKGYHGFSFNTDKSVTLEDDLSRRDLTINAIAQDVETGDIIDPFNVKKTLKTECYVMFLRLLKKILCVFYVLLDLLQDSPISILLLIKPPIN